MKTKHTKKTFSLIFAILMAIVIITLSAISVFAVLYIVSKRDKGAYKTLWVFLILVFPIFGGLFYLLVNFQATTRRMRKDILRVQKKTAPLYAMPGDAYAEAETQMDKCFPQVRYLQNYAHFPVYANTKTTYLSPGEDFHKELLSRLEHAHQYIFLEFFIIQEGVMWDPILEILKRKAAQGVKVYGLSDSFVEDGKKKDSHTVILGYGGLNMEEIEQGIEALKKAWL